MRGRGKSSGRCRHTLIMAVPIEDGRSFYGRCMVCGKEGPERQSSRAARRALLSQGSGETAGEDEEKPF